MQAPRGSGVQLLHVLNLGNRWGEWSALRPGCVLPPVPIGQEAGWALELVWTQRLEEKSLCPKPGIEPRPPSSVVVHYTD
jgi:hypothetical protein